MKRIVTTFLFISLFLCVYARGNAAESQIQLVRNATLLIDYAGHLCSIRCFHLRAQ